MNRLTLAAVVVFSFVATDRATAQHNTVRFFTPSGPKEVDQLAFSPRGDLLAVAVRSGPLTFVDPASGDVSRSIEFAPFTMAFSGDGAQLLGVSENRTKFIDARDGGERNVVWTVAKGHLGVTLKERAGKLLIDALAPGSPAADSELLHVGDELVGIIDSGSEESMLGKDIPAALKALSGPAGTLIVMRVVPKGKIKSVDVELRRRPAKIDGEHMEFEDLRTASSPNACIVATTRSLVVLDANSGAPVSVIEPKQVELIGMNCISPDGRLMALVARRHKHRDNRPNLGFEIFDVQRQEPTHFDVIDAQGVNGVRFSPDSKQLLIATYDRVDVYDLERKAYSPPILIGFDPAAHAPKKEDPPLIDVRPDIGNIGTTRVSAPRRLLNCFDMSPDGKMVAIVSDDGQCQLWSTERHERLATIGEPVEKNPGLNRVTFSPDGKWVAYFVAGTLNVVSVKESLAVEEAGE